MLLCQLTSTHSPLWVSSRLTSALALVLICGAATPVEAAPAPPPRPFVMGVRMEAGSQIKSKPGQVTLDCQRIEKERSCKINGVWTLHNPGDTKATAKGFLATHEAANVKVSVDTIDWMPPMNTLREICERYAPDMLMNADGCARSFGRTFSHGTPPALKSFKVALEPGQSQRVELSCEVDPGNSRFMYFIIPGALARHIVFGDFRGKRRYRVNVYAGDAPVDVAVKSEAPFAPAILDRATGETKPFGEAQLRVDRTLRLQFDGTTFFSNGGPVLGLGTAHDLDPGFRARFGYQVYAPHWLQYELSIDTDFKEQVVVAPTIEWVAPMLVLLPSLGLGVGLPIQVAPETRLGFRAQVSLMVGFIGFAASMDIFSGHGPISERTRWTLLGQISL